MTDMVERVARAIYEGDPESPFWHVAGGEHTALYDWCEGSDESPHPYYRQLARAAIAEVRAPLEARRKQIAGDIARYERELAEFDGVPHVFDPQALYPRRNLLNALIEEMDGERDDK